MSCPNCSRRLLSALFENVAGQSIALRPQLHRPQNSALGHNQLRAFTTRPQLRFTESLRFRDLKHVENTQEDSRANAVAPSNLNPEPKVESTKPEAAGEGSVASNADADPDPATLREDIGLPADEEDVQHRLWHLTGGLSGKRPRKAEAKENPEGDDKRLMPKEASEGSKELAERITKLVKNGGVKGQTPIGGPAKKDKNKDKKKAPWMVQKEALKEKFGEEGWQPRKKLSPDAMEGVRQLHALDPGKYTTQALANEFEVSPEAIRRILKSKWRPREDEQEKRIQRWEKRGQKIWESQLEKGIKPPKKWREMGVGSVKGGKHMVPKWKQKRFGRNQGSKERVSFSEYTRPRGAGANYGDEGGWNDRIL